MRIVASALLGIFLVLMSPFPAIACEKPSNARINTILAAGQLAETAIDCNQTVRILRLPNGAETNPLVPLRVTIENRAGHPGLCMAVGAALVGAEYAIFRCRSPFYMTLGLVGEAVNIRLNYLVLKGK